MHSMTFIYKITFFNFLNALARGPGPLDLPLVHWS